MKKRELQEKVITNLLKTSLSVVEYHKSVALNEKNKEICDKLIRKCKKALRKLPTIKHDEIVDSLFRTLTGNTTQLFIYSPELVISKQVDKWDNTKKGFDEFLYLEEEARKIAEEKQKQALKDKEAIQKAREEGKKVDLVFKDGRLQPVITEEKNNA